jgi:hypothetical protein
MVGRVGESVAAAETLLLTSPPPVVPWALPETVTLLTVTLWVCESTHPSRPE